MKKDSIIMELTKLYSDSDLILLKLAIYFFRILGLAPLKVENVNQVPVFYRTRLGNFYCCFLILLFSGLHFLTMPSILNAHYANKNSLTVIFDIARGIHGTLTSLITWVFILLQAEQIANIMNRIVDIDISINNLGICDRKSTKYLSIFLIIMNIFIWIILIFLDKYSYEVEWMTLAIIDMGATLPLFIVNWFLIEYTLFLIIIESRFDRVNCALAAITQSSNDFVFQTTSISRFFLDNSNVVNIREVKKINTKLYEVSLEILDLLEVPLLLEIIFLWGSIVISFYYLTIPWISSSAESRSLVVYADSAIWLSMEFFPLMAMVNATSGIEEKV